MTSKGWVTPPQSACPHWHPVSGSAPDVVASLASLQPLQQYAPNKGEGGQEHGA
jgi:hypothetical protein